MVRRIDIKHYYSTILAILKQVEFLKSHGAKSMTYKFPQHTDEIFKTLIVKKLKGKSLSVKRIDKDIVDIKWEGLK